MLLRRPRFSLQFTPSYRSWINLIERWFAELTTRWLRRGTHRSIKELEASIAHWVDQWNEDPRPFGHKSADEILEILAAYCQRRTSDTGHRPRPSSTAWRKRVGASTMG